MHTTKSIGFNVQEMALFNVSMVFIQKEDRELTTDIDWEIFRGAIFDGLLRQLPNFYLDNLRRTSVGKFVAERSSMDFFAHFRIFLRAILDGRLVGRYFLR